MTTKPTQVLSLLPGDYYHPEAKLIVYTYPDGTKTRGHKVHDKLHGIWEHYYWDGTLSWRRHLLQGKRHVRGELYREDGHLENLKLWYQNTQVPFFIETLLNTRILKLFT